MLSEREYRIKCINRYLPTMQGKKIVIYGTGINAKLLIDHAEKVINIIGLMDKKKTGKEIYGYKVMSEEEVISLNVNTIIIAAQIDSAIVVYKRIHDFCEKNNLEVFDLYGNNILNLIASVTELEVDFDKQSYSKIFYKGKIKKAVDLADVISVDLKVLFSNSINNSELFHQVWQNCFTHGVKSFVELRLKYSNQLGKIYGNLESIYSALTSCLCLSEENKKDLLRTELDLRRKNIKINPDINELINNAQINGKRLFLLNGTVLPNSFWISALKDNGFNSDSYMILNSSESIRNKFNGLYREIIDCVPNSKYLHIGNDYCADGIAPLVYGFQSIVIKDPNDNTIAENEQKRDFGRLQDFIRDYCTESVRYTFVENKFDGFVKLFAQEEYYIIVRRDTEIKPGWLEQLVNTAEEHDEASVICSRVSKENGTVLYAGTIITGNFDEQQTQMVSGYLPNYDYVRYVNQISLVSFLVRKTEWDKAEKIASELNDIVLAYINLTKKRTAIYQPFSEVVYKKSIIDVDYIIQGIYAPMCPRILVTDNLLTRFDHDAGSRTTWCYLNLFRKIGLDVTLMAQNFDEIQPYVMLLQQAGIRVIYGNYYRSHWETWLKEENDRFSYVYMQRPASSVFFLEEVKKYCKSATLFYYTHDLHFLRLFREFELTGSPESLRESEDIKRQECFLIKMADIVHVVGTFEQEYLRRMFPDKIIRCIPAYLYRQRQQSNTNDFNLANRKDLLSVFSFGHSPNLDAVSWFAEQIFPKIVMKYPNIVWHIVGANPPIDLQKYQGKNIVFHGFLSDSELGKMYKTCRIVVAPLRYGAGVKGKVVEASYYQIPIVTTPIGAEGIPQEENNMIICNSSEEFADAVNDLYLDEDRLFSMAQGGRKLIERYYTEEAAKEIIMLDIPEICSN